MRVVLLALSAVVLPFAWGWLSHWLLRRLWPYRSVAPVSSLPAPPAAPPIDFQI